MTETNSDKQKKEKIMLNDEDQTKEQYEAPKLKKFEKLEKLIVSGE